jgi:hypothetical protein
LDRPFVPPWPPATEVRIQLDDFGARAVSDEAARQRVPVERLAAYAVSYYLGDLDSGRLTRRLPSWASGRG